MKYGGTIYDSGGIVSGMYAKELEIIANKFNRVDSEITRMLHLHIRIFGYKINHIPIGTILSSLFGGLYNVKN